MPLHSLPLTYDDLTEEQWDEFRSRLGPHEESGCRYWVDKRGNLSQRKRYGIFAANGRQYQMHRLAYVAVMLPRGEAIGGDGLVVRHLCGDKRCCAPRHLEIGTHRENSEDFAKHRPVFVPSSYPTSTIPKIDPISDHALLYYLGDTRHPILLGYDVTKKTGIMLVPSHVQDIWLDLRDEAAAMIVEATQRRLSDRNLHVPVRSRHRLAKVVVDLQENEPNRISKAINRISHQAYLTPSSEIPTHIEVHPNEALVPTTTGRRSFVLRGSDAQEWWMGHRSTPLLRRMPTRESEYDRAVRLAPEAFIGWCELHIKRTGAKANFLPSRDVWSLMVKSYALSTGQTFRSSDRFSYDNAYDHVQVWGMNRREAMQRAGQITGLGPTTRVRPPRHKPVQGWRGGALQKCQFICCSTSHEHNIGKTR